MELTGMKPHKGNNKIRIACPVPLPKTANFVANLSLETFVCTVLVFTAVFARHSLKAGLRYGLFAR